MITNIWEYTCGSIITHSMEFTCGSVIIHSMGIHLWFYYHSLNGNTLVVLLSLSQWEFTCGSIITHSTGIHLWFYYHSVNGNTLVVLLSLTQWEYTCKVQHSRGTISVVLGIGRILCLVLQFLHWYHIPEQVYSI